MRNFANVGQTTIELMLWLSVSLVALSIIYSLSSGQIESNFVAKERATSNAIISTLVNAANTLAISGAGSSTTILLNIPDSIVVDGNSVLGPVISFKLSNGSDVFGIADVNFVGDLKKVNGAYVTGGYYVRLTYDGNAVRLSYNDFELSSESISFSAQQGTLSQKSVNVQNDSLVHIVFFVSTNFSHDPFAVLSIDPNNTSFTLAPGEIRRIDVNILLSSSAVGNYSGNISVTGVINDGLVDSNYVKDISVSAEALLLLNELMVYPKTTLATLFSGSEITKSFSVCNISSNSISGLSWSRDSNVDANMLAWFSWEPKNSDGDVIGSVNKTDCNYFDLNIVVPSNAPSGVYDANFTVSTPFASATAYLYVTVLNWNSLFLTSQNDFDINTNYFNSNFVFASPLGRVIPTGELDWNKAANYSFQSSDFNRDMNGLVGYWKFNDKNAQGWVLNSATGIWDGNLVGGLDTNGVGLWDTNAGSFDANNDFVNLSNRAVYNVGSGSFTISAWVNPAIVSSARDIFCNRYANWSGECTPDLRLNAGKLQLDYYVGGASSNVLGSTVLSLNTWHHVAAIFNNGNYISLYVDGVLDKNQAVGSVTLNNGDLTLIGVDAREPANPNVYYFNGAIDELKFWNRALLPSEIAADYNRFLTAKQVSIIKDVVSSSAGFSSLKVNSDINYNFGSEITVGESFFDQNLVGLWHLNDKNAQGWVLNAVSGVWDGNLMNGADTNGVGLWDSNACYFDGSDDYINFGNANVFDFGAGSFTISAWINTRSVSSADTIFCNRYADWSGECTPHLRLNAGNLELGYYVGSSYSSIRGTRVLSLNNWHHVVGVFNNGVSTSLYIDGALEKTQVVGSVTLTNGDLVSIGSNPRATPIYLFDGKIDEVGIWNRALSGSEVVDLYKKGVSRLDLNVFSCSDSSCASVVGSKQFTKISNNSALDISTLPSAQYLKYSAGFVFDRNIVDSNFIGVGAASGYSFLSDLNISYYN